MPPKTKPNSKHLPARFAFEAQLLAKFQQALASHQQGQLARAQVEYIEILRIQPKHFETLHLLGVIASQTNDHQRAVDLIDQAIALHPTNPYFYNNRGIALHKLTQSDKAIESYDKAIALKPDFFEVHNNRGHTLLELKQADAALQSYDRAVAVKPDYAEGYHNRANALIELMRLDDAVASCNKAIAIKSNYAEAYSTLGMAFKKGQHWDKAVESCKQAIAIHPDYAQAYNNLGQIYQELKKSVVAVANYDKAIYLQPDFAEAYCLRGDALTELKQLDAAIESYNKAIAIKPAFVEAFCNRGKALLARMLLDAAVDSFNQAIAAKPDSAEVFSNRGNAQQGLNQLSDAINSYNTAIALKPDWAEAYWNKAIALLLSGELQAGWELYEWRWKTQKAGPKAHNFEQPLWLGTESLVDKTILLHSEQGYGDTIQFCRYATAVLALGAQVILEAPLSLLSLLQGLDDAIVLVEKGTQLPDFDFHCPLLSLPFAFKTKLDTIPALPAYFQSDEEKVRLWSNRLGPKTTPRIGLVWSGSTAHKNDHNRSLTLAQLIEHLPKSYRYICLQKEQREVDKAALQAHPHVEFYGNALNDFADTAALCDLMDVIISVDTSVAHLAGALGKQTWILLPFSPDWRWLLNRTDSPWYPSVRLYRQDTIGDWSTILQRIKSDLQKHPVLSN